MKRRYIFAAALAVLALGCVKRTQTAPAGMPPLRPPEIDPALAGRIHLTEADFTDLYATFNRLLEEYNRHLVTDEYHPEEVEKEFFFAHCVEDELEITTPTDLPVYGRLEFVGIWCYGLFECCDEFADRFGSHVSYFHPQSDISVDTYEWVEVPEDSLEARLSAVEGNIVSLSNYITDLEESYEQHLEADH